MRTLHIDFETRSTVDLRHSGVRVYVEHPDTDIWLARYAIDDGPVKPWKPGDPLPDDLRWALAHDDVILCAHNVAFEWNVIEFICVPRYGWPRVDYRRLDCTASRAAVMALPRSLDGASKAMGLAVEKDDAGRRLMLQMARPRKPRKNQDPSKLYWWDTPEKVAALGRYCDQDVIVERELDHVLRPLTAEERRIWLLDFAMNNIRGVQLDMESVNAVVHALNYAYHSLREQVRALVREYGGPVVDSYTEVDSIKAWLEFHGVEALDSLDKAALEELDKRVSLPSYCKEMVRLRREGSKTSTTKARKMQLMAASDGKLYGTVRYHGAGTGRWAGQGVQLHNLPAREAMGINDAELALQLLREAADNNNYGWIEEIFETPMTAIASGVIRPLIIATEGRELFAADFSNIEGRVLAWLAGQEDLVQAFADGRDVYKEMASFLFGVPVSAVTKAQRQLGKKIILGCGYQMGVDRFYDSCQEEGVPGVDHVLAEAAVNAYREKNDRIKALWYALEALAMEAVLNPGYTAKYGELPDGSPMLAFRMVEIGGRNFLVMRLPSGRVLYYLDPYLEEITTPWGSQKMAVKVYTVDSQTGRLVRRALYGGLITENAVQGIARDLLANGMVNCEEADYEVLLTVHDEIVSERDEGTGSVAELESLMCQLPSWAAGCPVAAEGWSGKRYRK